ncbi:MAG: exosortase B [Proteobacteria bacterium]|nr:exosortase B [Pseudomonadota bacterium]
MSTRFEAKTGPAARDGAPALAVKLAELTALPQDAVLGVAVLVFGWLAMYGPTYWGLAHTVWATDEQGHGPIILALSAWLLYRKREALAALAVRPQRMLGIGLFALAWVCYVFGRAQFIWILEVGSQILMLGALLLYFRGAAALRMAWFPLFFMIFMVPLPGDLVAAVTAPLKSAVSAVASSVLYDLGYPIGRSGVIITVGQYQLLVADACAGLNSMFTLEALGLLYMNLMSYQSVARNVALAIMIIPISFVANVTRVMILVLVTYYFGDEAGQGFVHGFAGMVLFLVALVLILSVDKVIGRFVREP